MPARAANTATPTFGPIEQPHSRQVPQAPDAEVTSQALVVRPTPRKPSSASSPQADTPRPLSTKADHVARRMSCFLNTALRHIGSEGPTAPRSTSGGGPSRHLDAAQNATRSVFVERTCSAIPGPPLGPLPSGRSRVESAYRAGLSSAMTLDCGDGAGGCRSQARPVRADARRPVAYQVRNDAEDR
jgi:hypothetical protein